MYSKFNDVKYENETLVANIDFIGNSNTVNIKIMVNLFCIRFVRWCAVKLGEVEFWNEFSNIIAEI